MEKIKSKKLVSLIISVYNEEENIDLLYLELKNVLKDIDINYEIIFVNDGSKDLSLMKMMKLVELNKNIKIVNFSRNFGHEIAMTAGMDYAQGDALIFMDSDLQHPVYIVKEMIDKWLAGCEIILTRRIDNEDDSLFTKIIRKLYYKCLNFLSEIEISGGFPDFRLIDKKYIERIKQISERDRLFRGILNWIGITNYQIIDFKAPKRLYGTSKYNFLKNANLGISAILQFSTKPLRVITLFGLCASAISILYTIYIVLDHLILQRPENGFSTTVALMVILFSVQITIIGVIGEYVGRIHLEIKKRPLYFADFIENKSKTNNPDA